MIELLLGEAGIRPTGHGWSRDGAEEAALELGALARFLAPDARPVLRTWRRPDDGVWCVVDRPLIGTTWRWDADAGNLATEIDGVTIVAAPEARSWTILLQGQVATRRDAAWVAGPFALGAPGAVPIALSPGRLAGATLTVTRLGDGLPAALGATAALVGADRRIELGDGTIEGRGWSWRVDDPPAPPWGLVIRLGVVLPGEATSWEGALAVVEPCQLAGPRADDGSRVVHPGDRLATLRFIDAPLTPTRARLRLRSGAWTAEADAIHEGEGRYRLEPAIRLPERLPAPSALDVLADGQDAPVGALIVAPARVHGRWRLARDARGDAKRTVAGPEQLVLIGVPDAWTPAPGPDACFVIDGERVRVPIDADAPTLVLADPARGLVDDARLLGGVAGGVTFWVPGLPPIDVPVEPDGRVRPRGSSLRELAAVAAARGLALRMAQGEARGVVYPAQAQPGLVGFTEEVLPEGVPMWIDHHGVGFAVRRRGDTLQLDVPLPVDGRLGPDLPLPVAVQPDGDTLVVTIDTVRYGLRRRGAGWVRADGAPLPAAAGGDVSVGGVWLREEPRGWAFTGWVLAGGRWPGAPGLRLYAR